MARNIRESGASKYGFYRQSQSELNVQPDWDGATMKVATDSFLMKTHYRSKEFSHAAHNERPRRAGGALSRAGRRYCQPPESICPSRFSGWRWRSSLVAGPTSRARNSLDLSTASSNDEPAIRRSSWMLGMTQWPPMTPG